MINLSNYLSQPIEIAQPMAVLVGATPPDTLENGEWVRQGQVYLKADYVDLSATLGSLDSSPFTPISFPWNNNVTGAAYGDGLYVFTGSDGGIITNSTIEASVPQGFAWSFNGTSDYLRADAALASLSAVDSPFTIECWVWPRVVDTVNGSVVAINTVAAGANNLIASLSSITMGATSVPYSSLFTVGEWQHFVVSYTGTAMRVFRNGVQVGINNAALATAPSACVLGIATEFDAANGGIPGNYFNGYITNYRVTAGEALYTTTFTPPAEPFTTNDYTTLLTCNSADLVDTSSGDTDIAVFGDPMVVVGNFSPFNEPDTWDRPFTGTTSTINDVIHANGSFLAVGNTGLVIESANGATWRYPGAAIDDVYGIYNVINVNGETTVAAGGGQLRRSPDEIWWTPIDTGTTSSIRAITLGSLNTSGTTENIRAMIRQDNQYVAVGGGALIMTSTDAVTWNAPVSLPVYGTAPALNSIVYGDNLYMIAGDTGVLVTTTDLQTFNFSGLGLNPATITGVSNGLEVVGGLFVVGADAGQIRTSTNALTWRAISRTTTQNINVLTFGGGQYLLGGNNRLLQTSTDAITWTDRDSGLTTTTSAINTIIYGDGIYVYGATGGAVATSTDGITWTPRTSGLTSNIYDLLYAGGIYVLASGGTTALVLRSSTDAITWNAVTFGATATIFTLLYGNNTYVAAGQAGALRSSTDAITWTARTSGTASQIQAGIFGNGIFVIGGVGGYLATSTDGISWAAQTSGTTGNIMDINYSSTLGLYLYVTSLGISATSTDAVTWNVFQNNREITTNSIYSLSYGNGRYLYGSINGVMGTSTDAVSWNTNIVSGALATAAGTVWTMTHDSTDFVYAGGSGYIATSSDATTWTYYGTGINLSSARNSGGYYNGRYVVLSQNGQIRTSTDLVNWQAYRPLSATLNLSAFTYSPDQDLYVVSGASGLATIATSTDLVTWTARTSGTASNIQSLAYGNGVYVFTTNGGGLSSSTDGVTWTARTSGTATTENILSVIYAGSQWVFVGSAGSIRTSTDAITWTARTSGTATGLQRIVYVNDRYITGGNANNLRSSTDAITWTSHTIGVTNTIYGITYGNSTYVVAGQTGMLRSSTDLVTWTARTSGTTSDIYNVNYDSTSSVFYYIDINGLVGTSTDAVTWSTLAARNQGTSSFYSLTYTSGTYLAGAVSGAISQSSNAETWTTQTSGNTNTTFTVTSVIYADSLYVYGAQGGHIGTSTDGITWSRSNSETIGQVNSILYTATTNQWVYGADAGIVGTSTDAVIWQLGSPDSLYVMAGSGGMIQTSTDAITWQLQTTPTSTELYNVSYGGGLYVATGVGTLITSTDAVAWTSVATTHTWWGVAYAGDQNLWALSGAAGLLYTTTNMQSGGFVARTSGTSTTAVLYQLQYKNNLWMHAGNGGLFTSTNAITWTARTSGASGTIWSLTYGSGLYLYGDDSGGIGTSTDGVTWIRNAVLSSADRIYGLAYDATDSKYIMVSRFGESGTSTDGANWAIRPNNASGTTQNINLVAYDDNLYLLGTNTGTIKSSTDKINWVDRSTGAEGAINKIAHTGNMWIAVGDSGAFLTSTNGESWTSRGLAVAGIDVGSTLTSDGNGVFVQGAANGRVRKSTNLQDWSGLTTDTTGIIESVAYGNGQFVVGTTGTTLQNLRYSDDGGNTWQAAATGLTASITAIVYGANGWALTYNTSVTSGVRRTAASTITAATTWTTAFTSNVRFNGLKYANGLYVSVGGNGFLHTSTNNIAYTSRVSGTVNNIIAVEFGNDIWIYAGAQGTLATSTDAITWSQRQSGTLNNINGMTFGAGLFVYVADQGIVATSTDGVTWTKRQSNTTDSIMNVVWDGTSELFLYSTRSGSTATSTDGVAWSQPIVSRQTGIKGNINGVASDLTGNIVLVGDNSVLATSTDAVTWTNITTGLSGNFNSVTYGNNRWTLVGDSGILATSTDIQNWTQENSGTTENISSTTFQGNLYFYTSPGYSASSEDAVTPEYSPSYDVDTEFLVPNISTSDVLVTNETANNLSPATVEIYVKAKAT